jgi:hypothetical protein
MRFQRSQKQFRRIEQGAVQFPPEGIALLPLVALLLKEARKPMAVSSACALCKSAKQLSTTAPIGKRKRLTQLVDRVVAFMQNEVRSKHLTSSAENSPTLIRMSAVYWLPEFLPFLDAIMCISAAQLRRITGVRINEVKHWGTYETKPFDLYRNLNARADGRRANARQPTTQKSLAKGDRLPRAQRL